LVATANGVRYRRQTAQNAYLKTEFSIIYNDVGGWTQG